MNAQLVYFETTATCQTVDSTELSVELFLLLAKEARTFEDFRREYFKTAKLNLNKAKVKGAGA